MSDGYYYKAYTEKGYVVPFAADHKLSGAEEANGIMTMEQLSTYGSVLQIKPTTVFSYMTGQVKEYAI